jgi:hypothetical protein
MGSSLLQRLTSLKNSHQRNASLRYKILITIKRPESNKESCFFLQADVEGGKVIFYHSGPVVSVVVGLEVSDGEHGPEVVALTLPVQQLTLQALQSQAVPMRIQQGNNVQHLGISNVPSHTNGHPSKLQYNLTRHPLHGKLMLKDRATSSPHFSHQQLLQGIKKSTLRYLS